MPPGAQYIGTGSKGPPGGIGSKQTHVSEWMGDNIGTASLADISIVTHTTPSAASVTVIALLGKTYLANTLI